MERKQKVITIKGISERYGVSRTTVYSKYIPRLRAIPTTTNRKLFDFAEVEKVHESFSKEISKFEIVA